MIQPTNHMELKYEDQSEGASILQRRRNKIITEARGKKGQERSTEGQEID